MGALPCADAIERWEREGEVVDSYSIITTTANKVMEQLHHRMPVFLDPEQFPAWLTGTPAEAKELMRPCPDDWLSTFPVSTFVNNPRHQGEKCIEPVAEPD